MWRAEVSRRKDFRDVENFPFLVRKENKRAPEVEGRGY
jgi:hypothetical protein